MLSAFSLADAEERKVGIIADEVTKKQQDCEEDLHKAEPALLAAQVTNTYMKCIAVYSSAILHH